MSLSKYLNKGKVSTTGGGKNPALSSILARKNTPVIQQEIARICDLPIKLKESFESVENFNRNNMLARAAAEGFRFFDIQVSAIKAFEDSGTLFAPIGVGWGKTLITIAIASKAYETGTDKILLLVPPNVYSQLVKRDIQWARKHIPVPTPFHCLGNKNMRQRLSIAHSGRRGTYVLPYSCLQTKDSRELLNGISPELIICDEAHYLKNKKAARTKRLMAYVDKHLPKGVCLSGTITSKSIRDYHHLMRWCLGKGSVLPHSTISASEWSAVIDADADPTGAQTGPIMPLVAWAIKNFPDEKIPFGVSGFRKAYRLRLASAPGVVATGDEEIGVSLLVENEPAKQEIKKETLDLIEQVEVGFITPNGDPIDHAIHAWKYLYELNSGFWHRLSWPEPEALARRKRIPLKKAEDLIEAAKKHHEAHSEYTSLLRKWLNATNRPGLDTPMLVGQNISQHGAANVGYELARTWEWVKSLEVEGMPERDSTPELIDDFKIRAAILWVKENCKKEGAIIWFYHTALGSWLFRELKKEGIDAIFCTAGEEHNQVIQDPDNKNSVMVASVTAHGIGKNLQHFRKMHYLQWPRSAIVAEQSLGRTHRKGQKADLVCAALNLTTDFDKANLGACLNDALYISQSTGARQRLIYADYDPLPPVYPTDFLKERGFQPKQLNSKDQQLLLDTFKPKGN